MDLFEEYVTERLSEQARNGENQPGAPPNDENPAAPEPAQRAPFHEFQFNFIIPVEAYGLSLPGSVCCPLNIVHRFLFIGPDPHDGSGDRLHTLQEELREIALELYHAPYVMPMRWAQAGITAAVWHELSVIVTMEMALSSQGNRVRRNSWLVWLSLVYATEVALREAGIPVHI